MGISTIKDYLANMYIDDAEGSVCFALRYQASSDEEAEQIAQDNDWEYLGEFLWDESCPDEVEAIIQLRVMDPTVH